MQGGFLGLGLHTHRVVTLAPKWTSGHPTNG